MDLRREKEIWRGTGRIKSTTGRRKKVSKSNSRRFYQRRKTWRKKGGEKGGGSRGTAQNPLLLPSNRENERQRG